MSDSPKKPGYLAGVDLGGTKIMTGVFNGNLDPVGLAKITTKGHRGPAAVIDRIVRCIEDAVDDYDVEMKDLRGVGVGAPGSVEPGTGKVLFAPNLGWKNVPLKEELEKRLPCPVFVDNDCTVCTLGVYVREFESKPRHLIGIFLGTGIGGGLIINGQPYHGFNGTAGELGHMVIQVDGPLCACGNSGCFEALASRTAIFNQIRTAVKAGQKTVLTEILRDDLSKLRSGSLRKAIRKGDKFVEKLVLEAARYTGVAVASLINILNPEVVVLGGGIMEALEEEVFPTITKTARSLVMPGTGQGVQIVSSKLADNAGIMGAAVLAHQSLAAS